MDDLVLLVAKCLSGFTHFVITQRAISARPYNAGLSTAECAAVLAAHPPLASYHLLDEVQPRINYLKFLADNDRLGGESVASCIVRQPQSLERHFGVVHECKDYVVVNKPWCVRLDTPRGWPGRDFPAHSPNNAAVIWSPDQTNQCRLPTLTDSYGTQAPVS